MDRSLSVPVAALMWLLALCLASTPLGCRHALPWPDWHSRGTVAADVEPASPGLAPLPEPVASEPSQPPLLTATPVIATEVEPLPGPMERIPAEFAVIARLTDPQLQRRRQAAWELEQMGADRPLSVAALERLLSTTPSETDPLVWRCLLGAVGHNSSPAAAQLAYAALSHPDSETRRRACLYLQHHPSAQHLTALELSLEERDPRVLLAAIEAFAASAGSGQLAPLEGLTDHSQLDVQLAAAVALARRGQSAGYAALERLAGDEHPGIRRSAVRAMGQLEDPLFLPLLIILLEDRYEVRLAALEALPQVARCDPVADSQLAAANLTQRCAIWQQWYARGGQL